LRSRTLASVLALPLLATACFDDPPIVAPPDQGHPQSAMERGDEFVAVPRTVDAATRSARQQKLVARGAPASRLRSASSDTFYLAIKRSSLEQRWFLSAFLEQYFPGQVSAGAANSMGTRVVSFKVQNDKLFVFDVDDRVHSSGTFDPDRLIEAYPIVRDPAVTGLPGAGKYVIIDPAAGLNRFNAVSDAFTYNSPATRFEIELSFLQNFKGLADGVSYEQVFTGYANQQISDGSIDWNRLQGSGTLSIALRKYREGDHYVEVPPPAQPHYFLGWPRQVPNTNTFVNSASHWNIYPGMKPIEWLISPELAALDATEPYANIDLIGTVKKSIESWNDAFGFPVFTARVANADESFARDDLNYVIFDSSPGPGYAFANWRLNPNNNEILGATVYFGSGWVRADRFADDPPAGAPAAPRAHPVVPGLGWSGIESKPLCVMWDDDTELAAVGGTSQLTAGEKLERYVGQMITHEIGHDLGLRHNFKGSLLPPTSSVMEYSIARDRIAVGGVPQSYDRAAVHYLYGLSPDLPTQPFCTDEHADGASDPDCRRSDFGADPLVDEWQVLYPNVRNEYVVNGSTDPLLLDNLALPLVQYASAGDPARAAHALDILLAGVGAPLDPGLAADPTYAAGADFILRWALPRLAVKDAAGAARVDDQLALVLANQDGARSFTSRRAVIDLLKQRQTVAAYRMLLTGRDQIAADVAGGALSPDDELQARDLLARIDAATSPYFE